MAELELLRWSSPIEVMQRSAEAGTKDGFRAVFAAKNDIDRAGVILEPQAFESVVGEGARLMLDHGAETKRSVGAGKIRISATEAWLEGEINDTELARDWVKELETLDRAGIKGEVSVDVLYDRRDVRPPTEMQRNSGARAVIPKVHMVKEVSFINGGDLPQSKATSFERLARSFETQAPEPRKRLAVRLAANRKVE